VPADVFRRTRELALDRRWLPLDVEVEIGA
jgi:hypothetical protein